MSEAFEVKDMEPTIPPEAPAPKKRGRKRKSEMLMRQIEEEVVAVPQEETVSRRGRRRKKVNYYELANPDNADYSLQLEDTIYLNLESYEPKNTAKKTPEKNRNLPEAPKVVEMAAEENVTQQNENGNADITISNGTETKSSPSSETVAFEGAIDEEATSSTPNSKDKRYNYTGETVKMMNTLFTLFTNPDQQAVQESTNEINTSSSNNNVSTNSSSGKRPYKRAKKIKEEDIDDGSGNVSCAICNTTLDKTLWSHHKQRYHNNLAWRVGDPPLDLNDQSFVMHTLNLLYKKKKPLYCDKCGEVKKSVVGFLSHRSQCLKSEEQLDSVKITCELCGKKMLPVSMSTHMKTIHQNPSEKEKEVADTDNEICKPVSSKRSAARKAMRIIENVTKIDNKDEYYTNNLDFASQEFAKILMQKELEVTQFFECKFRCNCITTNMEDALKHMEECTEKPDQGFVCKKCLHVAGKVEEIIYHIDCTHEIAADKDCDEHIEKDSKYPSFLRSYIKKTEKVLFPHAFEWTNNFCKENFSDLLFTELSSNKSHWTLLSKDQAVNYLPKMNESCQIARTHVTSFINPLKQNYTLKNYNLFESEIHDTKITIFCGGPISSISWLPTPYSKTDSHQILAVSVLNSPDEKYLTSENSRVKSAIQFWDFGSLSNTEYSLKEPQLLFNLAHSHGPIWHMEWCPSGCYNDDRMGLLAVTGSDAVVYIYAIPMFDKDEAGLYYKPKPVMKLLLQRSECPLLGGLKYYPSKISWSKASRHQYVCVGYTNGFIALFNLTSNSFILKFKDSEGIPCILPNKCFQAHSHSITAIALYHLNGGCRWLMTGSFDRRVSFWDLENHNYPICNIKKNIVTDGFWLTNWLCYVTTFDEGSTSTWVTTMMKQIRDYSYDPNVTLTCSSSTISSVTGSDWLNGMLHANTVGEIVGLFPHQILQFPEHQKVLKTKRMLFGYTYLLEKDQTPEKRMADESIRKKTLQNLSTKKLGQGVKLGKIKPDFDSDGVFVDEPVLYEEAEKKYALLFCDNIMQSYDDFPKSTTKQLMALSKTYANTHPNRYPLNTINKIAFNPNRQASLYYATGYQAGFVRISWMEFLKDDHQIK